MTKRVEFEVAPSLNKYNSAMNAAIKTAARFDGTMRELGSTAKAIDRQLGKIDGKIKVDVTTDTSSLDRAEGKVDAIDGMSPDVAIDVDTSKLDNVSNKIAGIDGQSPTINVAGDATQLDRIEQKINALDRMSPKVDVAVDGSAVDKISEKIDQLNTTATLSLVIQGAAQARETFSSTPVLGTLHDQEQAMRNLEVTGVDVENAMKAVSDVWTSNWGQSRVEIAGVVAELAQLKVPDDQLTDAATSVFELTAGGRELTEVFRAQKVLVQTGVAGSFREAADIIAYGFTTAAGTSEDFLDTLSEYAPQLQEMGISAQQFIGYLNEGVIAGAWNTDKLADSLKESNVRIEEAVATAAGPAAEALARIGQVDEAEAYVNGELAGTEFVAGVIAAAETSGTNFDLYEIFGSGAEDLGAKVLEGIDWSAVDVTIPEDQASTYAATLTNTIGNDWSALTRTMGDQFLGIFQNATGGIDQWIAEARRKIQVFLTELKSGKGFPEALELALQTPGLADSIRQFESVAGNLVLGFEEAVASVIEALGGDAGGIRADIASRGASQFQYDLQLIENPEDVEQLLSDAVRRGVSPEAVDKALSDLTTELLETGRGSVAEAIAGAAGEVPAQLEVWASGGLLDIPLKYTFEIDPESAELMTDEELAGLAADYAERLGRTLTDFAYVPGLDTTVVQERVDEIKGQIAAAFSTGDLATGFNLIDQFFPEDREAYESQVRGRLGTMLDTVTSTLGDLVITSDLSGEQTLGFENMFDFTDESGRVTRFKDATLLDLDSVEGRFFTMLTGVQTVGDDFETAFGDMAIASDVSVAQVNAASDLLLLELQTNTEGIISEINAQRDAYLELGQAAYDAWVAGGMVGPAPATPPGRASGGDVSRGKAYKVGERGEELFVPGADGLIIPNQLTSLLMAIPQMFGGGSSIVNNTNIVVNTSINSTGTSQLMGGASRLARSIRGM